MYPHPIDFGSVGIKYIPTESKSFHLYLLYISIGTFVLCPISLLTISNDKDHLNRHLLPYFKLAKYSISFHSELLL